MEVSLEEEREIGGDQVGCSSFEGRVSAALFFQKIAARDGPTTAPRLSTIKHLIGQSLTGTNGSPNWTEA